MVKIAGILFLMFALFGCGRNVMEVSNEKVKSYSFLDEMYRDAYFPNHLVDKGKNILLALCLELEKTPPESEKDVYRLTHAATEKFNKLALEFENEGSEIETAARENIGRDVEFILQAYGYDLDIEEAIAPRDW